MGLEAQCRVTFQGQSSQGKTYLESENITFRGTFRFDIPVKNITRIEVNRDQLRVTTVEGVACFELGAELAEKWAHKLKNPRGLLDKLGVKAGQNISVLGMTDGDFLKQLAAKVGTFHEGKAAKDSDIIFLAIEQQRELEQLKLARESLKRDGAIWVIRPKGKVSKLSDGDVRAAAKAHGLSDVKVAKFSETHTAEKLVIPLALR